MYKAGDTHARTVQDSISRVFGSVQWRDTHARTVQRINFRPELGDSQAGDKVGASKTGRKPECVDSTGFIKRGKKLLMKILYPFASALRLRLMPMF